MLPAAHPDYVDYEAELAVVIGRTANRVEEADALSYIAGAMPFNDVSARDLQLQNPLWTSGKAIDTFAPCGPALVTLDEAGDLGSLALRTRINGKVVQEGNTSNLIFSVAERGRMAVADDHPGAGRHHRHRHPRRRGWSAGDLPARRRHGRSRDRAPRRACQPGPRAVGAPTGSVPGPPSTQSRERDT